MSEIGWLNPLKKMDPDGFEVIVEFAKVANIKTIKDFWKYWPHGYDMLYYWAELPEQMTHKIHRKIVLCGSELARNMLHYVPHGEWRPLIAIEAAERWARHSAKKNRLNAEKAAMDAQYANALSEDGIAARRCACAAALAASLEIVDDADIVEAVEVILEAMEYGMETHSFRFREDEIVRKHLPCPKYYGP